MKKTIYLILIALLLASCRTPRVITAESRQTQTDSIVIRETIRDTTVIVEADSSMISALVECDSMGRAYIRQLTAYRSGERLQPPKITIEDNILTATATADSLNIKIQLLERQIESHKAKSEVRVEFVEVNRPTWWQQLWIKIGKAAAVLTILLTAYKIFNYVRKR